MKKEFDFYVKNFKNNKLLSYCYFFSKLINLNWIRTL